MVLEEHEIEGFFTPRAIERWLRVMASIDVEIADLAEEVAEAKSPAEALDALARRHLHRPYVKTIDGPAIAALMSESEIPMTIRGLLSDLAT